MSTLVDTNILLRITQIDHPHHPAALRSLEHVLAEGEPACFTLQNVAEFCSVVTRPVTSNGLGYDVGFALKEVEKTELLLTLLPDAPQMYRTWKRLMVEHEISGVKVHDTRLVANMVVHGVERLLTFNTKDFTRFTEITTIDPETLIAE
jgi:predicted nucleic acid-binding protein